MSYMIRCDLNHEPVVYTSGLCPLCEEIKKSKALQETVDAFHREAETNARWIDQINAELERLKNHENYRS